MDFYTIKGSNANKFFKLKLSSSKYYKWSEVVELANQIYETLPQNEKEEYKKSIKNYQNIIDGRVQRELQLRARFNDYKIKFIPHSYFIRNYIMYNRGSINDVVQKMYMMKILFEDCDIINKWEKYKVKKSQQIYTFDEKEKFYEDIYKEYMKSHPDLDYFKQ